jgi:hypothetical protein
MFRRELFGGSDHFTNREGGKVCISGVAVFSRALEDGMICSTPIQVFSHEMRIIVNTVTGILNTNANYFSKSK